MGASAISNYVPKISLASPEQIAKNVNKIAIPAMVLVTASMINGAQAVGFVECMDNCNRDPNTPGIAKLICYTLCAIFSKD